MAVVIEAAYCKGLYVEVPTDSRDVLPQARLNVCWDGTAALFGAEDHVHPNLDVVVSHGERL
jgi:hypothetical protein